MYIKQEYEILEPVVETCPVCKQKIDYGIFNDRAGNKFFIGYYCHNEVTRISSIATKPSTIERWYERFCKENEIKEEEI